MLDRLVLILVPFFRLIDRDTYSAPNPTTIRTGTWMPQLVLRGEGSPDRGVESSTHAPPPPALQGAPGNRSTGPQKLNRNPRATHNPLRELPPPSWDAKLRGSSHPLLPLPLIEWALPLIVRSPPPRPTSRGMIPATRWMPPRARPWYGTKMIPAGLTPPCVFTLMTLGSRTH